MMEKTDEKKNEVDWQLRTSVIKEDDTHEWKKRRAAPLTDLQKLAKKVTFEEKGYTFYDEGQTRIMASLVPDEIIYNIADYSKREFSGCLLFGDVSGFTDLCEKYNKSGKGGPSRLTQVLNNYIGAMVQEILSHGGDVLHFSGDAFIALWKVTDRLSMKDAVHEALDCSLLIQKSYGTYQTDVDVVVRVKLAVASGSLVFSLVGNEEISHYIMTGQPIYDIKAAESISSAGEIVITPRVTCHINANEYLINVLPDGLHAKVLGVGPNWRNIQRQYDAKESRSLLTTTYDDESDTFQSKTSLLAVHAGMSEEDADMAARVVSDQYALRPAVNHADRLKMKSALRKFIIAPVVRGIDAEEPLEYLTEIRQVTILFINCKVSPVDPVEAIDIANKIYIIVCNVVKNKYGCVNKINNFDKDLMLLVIFGLRGFKHELETQIALQCATKCYDQISSLEHVEGVAAAVTRGKTYCGVFGYSLRREYTVIGLIVNKAARLMVAYPNKVTCDRDTFLHSKLEARNFILQNYKPLKGIVNPGPVYEFEQLEKSHDIASSVNPLPLLGREQKLDLFHNQMNNAINMSMADETIVYCSMLIFKGYFRQGKTRLLEEMLYTVDPKIPTNTFSLTKYDQKSPYKAIRLIFANFVGLARKTTEEERKGKIRARLKKRTTLLNSCWVLNEVFKVNFLVTENLTEEQKFSRLSKIFSIFCRECFTGFWVILIDDSEFIDDESWMLIQILLDLNLIFIVATMGIQEISTYVIEVLRNQRIQIVDLKPIDNWYHAGLACQMLDIEGIPPELEKTLQLRSNGNPGWIESFLATLMQSGGLYIEDLKRIQAFKMGLVLPPLYMLVRFSDEEHALWKKIMEEHVDFKQSEMAKRWELFVDSCRESYPDLTVAKRFSRELRKSKLVSVCTISSKFNLNDVEPELHIDVVILQTFDSLTSYEQLLLKCSAVLGDVFPRDMLLYIMSSSAIRLTALAVQKLFEIHVLSCARGNFVDGGLSFKARLINPNEDLTIKCECTGMSIDDTCADLPKYASCGYLRFRSSEFRVTTYNLLTDNQKREFHTRAIRYLEKETRKCRACGYGYFLKHTMASGFLDEGLRNRKRTNKLNKSIVSLLAENTKTYNVEKIYDRTSLVSSFSSTKLKSLEREMSKRESVSTSSTDSLLADLAILPSHNQFGFTTIRKLKNKFNLIKTFSASDFSQCTCLLILDTMYAQLLEHCKGAGLVEKIMNATVEYSYVCFESSNEIQAIRVLEEALQLLEGPMKDQIELEWMVSLKRGKLLALLGGARLHLKDDEAYTYLTNALDCYGVKFPNSHLGQHILKFRYKLLHGFKLFFLPNCGSSKRDDDIANYSNNVSECLSFLCEYFQNKSMWKEAELAALWSLWEAVKTETDFEKMCTAYSNLILVSTILLKTKFCLALEIFAFTLCHKKVANVEYDELKAVTNLYYCIARAKLSRAELERAMQLGYLLLRLSNSCRAIPSTLKGLPMLAYLNLLKRQIPEFSNLLQEIWYYCETHPDNTEKAWYYSLSLQLHMEVGLSVIPTTKCYNAMQSGIFHINTEQESKLRFIVLLWLWEIRNENWEAAMVWQDHVWSFQVKEEPSFHRMITAMYVLEGTIIYMVNKMDMKNLKAAKAVEGYIENLFKKYKRPLKLCKFLEPRKYHLKAYYTLVRYNDFKQCFKYLARAKTIAEKQKNELEIWWIKHSEQAWCNRLSKEDKYFWRNHCDEENVIDCRDYDVTVKCLPYSLPLQLYI